MEKKWRKRWVQPSEVEGLKVFNKYRNIDPLKLRSKIKFKDNLENNKRLRYCCILEQFSFLLFITKFKGLYRTQNLLAISDHKGKIECICWKNIWPTGLAFESSCASKRWNIYAKYSYVRPKSFHRLTAQTVATQPSKSYLRILVRR